MTDQRTEGPIKRRFDYFPLPAIKEEEHQKKPALQATGKRKDGVPLPARRRGKI